MGIETTLCLLLSTTAPEVVAASSLGDELGEAPHALAVDDDGNVFIAGARSLVQLDEAGEPAGPPVRLLGGIDDVAIDAATGNVAVAGPGELRLFGPELAPLWRRRIVDGDGPHRLGVGEHGTLAVSVGDGLDIVAQGGELLAHVGTTDDIAAVAVLDDAALVVATGTSRACPDGATLAGFGHDGATRWEAWDGCADAGSRGVDIVRGEDGMIYALAELEHGSQPAWDGIAFDETTTRARIGSALFGYYARLSPRGELLRGQYLGFADELSVLQPLAIAADRDGNVHVVGTSTHTIEEVPDDADVVEALGAPAAFHQIVGADFEGRRSWLRLELDESPAEAVAVALAPDRALALVRDPQAGGGTIVGLPRDPTHADKKPDREDVGTFGYESGVAGADPTCYCDAQPRAGVLGWLALAFLGLRRRR